MLLLRLSLIPLYIGNTMPEHNKKHAASVYAYSKTGRFFAQYAEGMDAAVKEELRDLGIIKIRPSYRGVFFETDMVGMYRVNYRSRIISRVLAPLLTFDCHSTKYLYKTAMKIDWTDFLSVRKTFAISSTVSNSAVGHSQYAGLVLKDAIVDFFRERFNERPSVDSETPDVRFNLHIQENRASISLDTSGEALHRRGYRKDSVEAPMRETLAAAIIRLSGWDGSRPLYDPMCGSGTLLSEALMSYCRIPSGRFRTKFGFENLPDFDRNVWKKIKAEEDASIRPLPPDLIAGSDIAATSIAAARRNLNNIPGGESIRLTRRDFNTISDLRGHVIVCNPPYGIRSGKDSDMEALYHSLGEFLKHNCTGAEAYIYIGERHFLKHMALRKSWKHEMKNGGLDGILVKFELY